MKKKFVFFALLIAMVSSLLTVAGICFLFGVDSKGAFNIGRLFSAMYFIETHYVQNVERDKLIDGAISGMVHSLGDPHSIYLAPQLYNQIKAETSGAFGGIGVYMGLENETVYIVGVIPDGPGEKIGLKEGDAILAVDSKPVAEIGYEEVALKIRGEVGTTVDLLIHRDGDEDKTYTITRDIIKVQTVRSKMLDNGIGYLRISNFSDNTGKEFKNEVAKLEGDGMKGLILDLRHNPGGVVTSCVEVAKQIVPAGPIVSVIQRDGTKEVYMSDLPQTKFPIAVLIDQNSASAAEILSGALQDTKAGVIVGMKSYGKGSIQTLYPMFHDDGLKLTIAKYYTPNGRSIDGVGVVPDFEVQLESPVTMTRDLNLDFEKDLQLVKAEEVLIQELETKS